VKLCLRYHFFLFSFVWKGPYTETQGWFKTKLLGNGQCLDKRSKVGFSILSPKDWKFDKKNSSQGPKNPARSPSPVTTAQAPASWGPADQLRPDTRPRARQPARQARRPAGTGNELADALMTDLLMHIHKRKTKTGMMPAGPKFWSFFSLIGLKFKLRFERGEDKKLGCSDHSLPKSDLREFKYPCLVYVDYWKFEGERDEITDRD